MMLASLNFHTVIIFSKTMSLFQCGASADVRIIFGQARIVLLGLWGSPTTDLMMMTRFERYLASLSSSIERCLCLRLERGRLPISALKTTQGLIWDNSSEPPCAEFSFEVSGLIFLVSYQTLIGVI